MYKIRVFTHIEEKKINNMIDRVCDMFDVTRGDMMGYKWEEEYRYPRAVIYYILLREYNYSLSTCRRFMNRKAHQTLTSGANKIEGYLDFDEDLKRQIVLLK